MTNKESKESRDSRGSDLAMVEQFPDNKVNFEEYFFCLKKRENLYEILGVERTATEEEIKRAYKKLALKYHPDKNQNEETTEMFRKINRAHKILSKPKFRAIYDQYGSVGIYIIENVGEEYIPAYMLMSKTWFKALVALLGVMTGCFFCCCCFCMCCCNFCCGKHKPKNNEADEFFYQSESKANFFPDEENRPPHSYDHNQERVER